MGCSPGHCRLLRDHNLFDHEVWCPEAGGPFPRRSLDDSNESGGYCLESRRVNAHLYCHQEPKLTLRSSFSKGRYLDWWTDRWPYPGYRFWYCCPVRHLPLAVPLLQVRTRRLDPEAQGGHKRPIPLEERPSPKAGGQHGRSRLRLIPWPPNVGRYLSQHRRHPGRVND
jgi:hypothetical protein